MTAFTSIPPADDSALSLVVALGTHGVLVDLAAAAPNEESFTELNLAAGDALERATKLHPVNLQGVLAKLSAIVEYAAGEAIEFDYVERIKRDIEGLAGGAVPARPAPTSTPPALSQAA